MKIRRVLLTLEVETNAPLKYLRRAKSYDHDGTLSFWYAYDVIQAQANVQQEKKLTVFRLK